MPSSVTAPANATLAADMVATFVDYAVTRGAHAATLLRTAGLAHDALAVPESRIALAHYLALVRAAARACDDPAIALHYGDAIACADVSMLGVLGGMERTVHDAFAQVNRFARLNFDPGMPPGADRFRLAMEDGALWLSDLRPDAAASMEITESTFARFAAGTRRVAGPGVLRAVHVAHAAPAHADAYARLFGVPVTFASARTALVFDPSLATRAVAQQPRTVRAVVVAHAESRLAALDAATTTATRVAALVRAHLHGGAPAMAWVARELAMSRRTLHRRLADDGTSYDGVVDGVRREVALARLASPGASVKAVAHATGFSEPAAFTRAFRRWTGRTPSEALRQAG